MYPLREAYLFYFLGPCLNSWYVVNLSTIRICFLGLSICLTYVMFTKLRASVGKAYSQLYSGSGI